MPPVPIDLGVLSLAAISIGFFHTLFGPDHYIPFVAMSQAGQWTMRRTILVTLLCGLGHVGSSVALGFIGIAMGIVVMQLETVESLRGELAGWLLLTFGAIYFVWGLRHARQLEQGQHPEHHHPQHHHSHHGHTSAASANPYAARDTHDEGAQSAAAGESMGKAVSRGPQRASRISPWALAVIFVLGPCEPLIPLLMYPAAKASLWGVACVAILFSSMTLLTMTAMVVAMRLGIRSLPMNALHHYSHAIAGFAVLASGLAIQFGL